MSDDEDIESLRIAALQSLIKKSVPDTPKSSSIQQTLVSVNRDFTLAPYLPPPAISNVPMDVLVNTCLPPPFFPPPSQPLYGVTPIYSHPPPSLPPWEGAGQNINSRVSPLPPAHVERRLPLNFRGQRGNRGRHIRNRRGDRLEHRRGRDGHTRGAWKEGINTVNRKPKGGTAVQENSVITVIKTVECSELNCTNFLRGDSGDTDKPQETIGVQNNVAACTRVLTVTKEKRESNFKVKAKDKFERFRDSDASDSSEEESTFGSESDIEPEKVTYDEEPQTSKKKEEFDQQIPQDLDNVSSNDEFLEEIVEEEEAEVQTTINNESHQDNGIADGNVIETVVSNRVTGSDLNSDLLETRCGYETKSIGSVLPIGSEYDLQQPIIDSSTGRSPVNKIRNRLGRRNFPAGSQDVSSPYRRSPFDRSPIRRRNRTPSLSPSPPADHRQSLIADDSTRSPRPVRVIRSSRSRSPRRQIRRISPVRYPSPGSRRRSPYSGSPSRLTSIKPRRSIGPEYSPSRKLPSRQSTSPLRNVHRSRSRSPLRRIELTSRRSSPDRDVASLRSSGVDVAKDIGATRVEERAEEERQARFEARRRKFNLGEVVVPIKRKIVLKSLTSSQKKKETTTDSNASEEEHEVKKKSKKKKDKKKKKKKEKKIRKKKKRKSTTESESEVDEENDSLKLKDKKLKKALSAIESLAGFKIEIKPKVDVKSNEEVSSSVDLRQRLQKRKIRSSQKGRYNYNDSESERSPDIATSRQGSTRSLDSVGRNVASKYEGKKNIRFNSN
ncbi:uncharacterized protein LOC136040090 isoform X2 [Artemia franciscana]